MLKGGENVWAAGCVVNQSTCFEVLECVEVTFICSSEKYPILFLICALQKMEGGESHIAECPALVFLLLQYSF